MLTEININLIVISLLSPNARSPSRAASPHHSRENSPRIKSPGHVTANNYPPKTSWSTCPSSSVGQESDDLLNFSDYSFPEEPKLRVCMMGYNATGKTSLVSQFLTSEYMNTYDSSLGK